MVSFTLLVVAITKKMRALYTIFLKSRWIKTTLWSRETQWSIQDMVTQLAGSEKSSLLSLAQERKKTSLRLKLKCTTQISISGLRCLIWMLVDIITHLAHSLKKPFSCFVVLPIKLESTSTLLRDTIMPGKNHGLWSILIKNFSQKDKDVASFREMDKIS